MPSALFTTDRIGDRLLDDSVLCDDAVESRVYSVSESAHIGGVCGIVGVLALHNVQCHVKIFVFFAILAVSCKDFSVSFT